MTNTSSWTIKRDLPNDEFRIANLMMLVERYMSEEDSKKVYDAFVFAEKAHKGIMRKDGLPYITHPLEVARILADLRMDVDVIRAALLHDVVEDCEQYTIDDISSHFNATTAKLVQGVTKLDYDQFPDKQTALIATFRNLMKTMTDDFRVVLIKLSDRLHNLSTMSAVPMKSRRKKADESFDLYIPLARRMGMNKMRRDLQELALAAKYPWREKILRNVVEQYNEENAEKHALIIDNIQATFERKQLKASVLKWSKNLYRLYSRLKIKGEKLNPKTESLDLRILVSTKEECYQALCILHELYPPIIGTFKDFIATPKIYGFQALETFLLTPEQQTLKIQIQTHDMYKVAQYGVTAKWRHPEVQKTTDIPHKALQKWLNQVDEIYQYDLDVNDFYRDIQAELFLQEIYVSTPDGKTIELPYGSNSIDFAYAIHTDLGNHCAETRVDGKKVPLKMPLYNGAMVKIIRSEMASPQASWLNSVVTGKATASIRSWLNKRKDIEFVELGKQVLTSALQEYNLEEKDIDPEKLSSLLETLHLKSKEDLLTALGKGQQCGRLIVLRLFDKANLPALPEKNDKSPMLINGTEGLLVNLQDCCHPIPNDRIIARLNATQGLEIHRADCPSLQNIDTTKNEFLAVSWAKTENTTYTAPLDVTAKNKIGVLSNICLLMEKHQINIENVNIETDINGYKIIHFIICITNENHLKKIMNSINKQECIIDVKRPF